MPTDHQKTAPSAALSAELTAQTKAALSAQTKAASTAVSWADCWVSPSVSLMARPKEPLMVLS